MFYCATIKWSNMQLRGGTKFQQQVINYPPAWHCGFSKHLSWCLNPKPLQMVAQVLQKGRDNWNQPLWRQLKGASWLFSSPDGFWRFANNDLDRNSLRWSRDKTLKFTERENIIECTKAYQGTITYLIIYSNNMNFQAKTIKNMWCWMSRFSFLSFKF